MADSKMSNHPGLAFWGKYIEGQQKSLPLAAHCLDVGVMFRALSEMPAMHRALVESSERPITDFDVDRLALLAMLHDAGKANLGFQRKVLSPEYPRAGHVRELAPLLDAEVSDPDLQRRFLDVLGPTIGDWFADDVDAYCYLLATFSHHGRPVRFNGEMSGTYWQARTEWWVSDGTRDPMDAVSAILEWGRRAFPRVLERGPALPKSPQLHHRFAGLVSLADWLGSNARWFPIENVSFEQRVTHDRSAAPAILRVVGLDPRTLWQFVSLHNLDTFRDRFPYASPPRPLQAALDSLPIETANAHLLIAEAETGSGKTEAALNWWYRLFRANLVDGLFFALPTRVAAQAMYDRVNDTIVRWFPDPLTRPVTVLATPGYSQVDGLDPSTLLAAVEDSHMDLESDQWRNERVWAAEGPKRFLAGTVVVGTIDQGLLSVLQVNHAHLRSVCVDRHLLVVDEVHASDVYMTALLERLLDHHLSIDGYALLLSATLGSLAKSRYVKPPSTPAPLDQAIHASYPALTFRDGTSLPVSETVVDRHIALETEPWAFIPERVCEVLERPLQAGARVLVVMNTVARAIALLRAVEESTLISSDWIYQVNGLACPHHGRFSRADRAVMDRVLVSRFGARGPDGPALVIGTQTLEQSLDLDADFLVTDLAPADVLLQRIGRLHRHAGRVRPSGLSDPRCVVLTTPEDMSSALDKSGRAQAPWTQVGLGSVYEDLRVLELTRQMVSERQLMRVPSENRLWVEGTTHPDALGGLTEERWKNHGARVEGKELALSVTASHVILGFDEPFHTVAFRELGQRVTTRLGLDTLSVPLSRPVISPFGQTVTEMLIPGFMAPRDQTLPATVLDEDRTAIRFAFGDRTYRYTRFGLEVETPSA